MSKGVLWLWIVLWKAAYCEFVRCSVVFIQKHSSSIILLKFLTTKHGPEKQNTAINNGHHSLTSSASKSKGHRGLSSLYLIPWPINTKYIYLNGLTLKYNIYHFLLNVRMLLLMTDMQFHSTMITSYHCPGIKFYSQVNLWYIVPDTRD